MQSHKTYYMLLFSRVAQHVCSLHLNSVQSAELYFYVRFALYDFFVSYVYYYLFIPFEGKRGVPHMDNK